MRSEKFEEGPVRTKITGIEDDMGTSVTMDLLIEQDGDVVLTLRDVIHDQQLEINFNTFHGGTRHPGLAQKLREVADLIQEDRG